jgi:outer membrane protein OmpA-like peptidoglycan-associated protein
MTTDTTFVTRSHEENWQPVLELAIEEVFEIMVGCRVKPTALAGQCPEHEFTAMVGLTGSLSGILTICCGVKTARALAKAMLGAAAESEAEVGDALGEICNMVTGNFESGSSKIKTTSQPAFDRIAGMLRRGDYRLCIEGHTDNVPIHNSQFPSNWELSTARSTEIVRMLIVRDGFRPERLSAAGYAEYHPLTENRTAEGRGANRRVDIIILGKPAQPLPAKATGDGPTAAAPNTRPAQILPAAGHPALLKPSALQPQVPVGVGERLSH